ncbi:sulfite exporter TauE/SafE family protein [Sagittula salina]|uniref:Probable membrane transporter protein n=1 Tax=Sagittula salina TaxID=2820268 RepID=A0A940MQ00_9RHOB|nr:sulfite exporter TauE/SafE family protein [Sagittula salina]MBP0482626.1 sulfite exporter TauE/SafE family protein [Sagittula salina]
MDLLQDLPATVLLAALAAGFLAGVVKGMVGFAMPMVLISSLSSFLPPEVALAGLILPTVVTNGMQALRQGAAAAWRSVKRFRLFLGLGLVTLLGSAQLVAVLDGPTLLVMIGVPIVLFACAQLAGWQLRIAPGRQTVAEAGIGAFAGFIGGLSGVWGPPTVAYLTALGTEKAEQMRVQGVIYGLGAVALVGAHIASGVLNGQTAWFSAALLVPAILGMVLGQRVQDRIDQAQFRRATLFVLLLAGLNLVRRGLS